MKNRTVLVIGAGLLGSYIFKHGARLGWDMHGTYLPGDEPLFFFPDVVYDKLDVIRKHDIERIIDTTKPDLVIDTAAYCDVDGCEADPGKSWKINVEGTTNVYDCCRRRSIKMAFISTDYVFDGRSDRQYKEHDACNPLNVYGKHKLEAEKIVLQDNNLVCRTSVIYGSGRPNFVLWVINELRAGRTVTVVNDQYNCPTYAGDLAGMIAGLQEQSGIFHTVGRECLNRYEFALRIAEVFGLDPGTVRPIATGQLKQRARRPVKCDLSIGKIEQITGLKPMSAVEGLRAMKEEEYNG